MWLGLSRAGKALEARELRSGSLTLGRDASCDVVLDDDEASRTHARITVQPDGSLVVEDLGSLNGSFVDGARIEGPTAVGDGGKVRVGETTIAISETDPSHSTRLAAGPAATEIAAGAAAPTPPGAAPQPDQTQSQFFRSPKGQSTIRRALGADSGIRALAARSRRNSIIAIAAGVVAVIAIAAGVLFATGVLPPRLTIAELVSQTRPSAVLVNALVEGRAEPVGSGTGWVLDEAEGLIVTNAHVAQRGESVEIEVDGEGRETEIVGVAPCEDLAVLRVEDTSALRELPLGSQAELRQGERVVALGFPRSISDREELVATVGAFSVVKTRRSNVPHPVDPSRQDPRLRPLVNVVRIDAAINPGNSGGPLVNREGELVGVNTFGAEDTQNENYAIGVDRVLEITDQIRAGETPAWLGMNFDPVDRALSRVDGRVPGLHVTSVQDGTRAQAAGFGDGPVALTAVDGRPVDSFESYCTALEGKVTGDVAEIDYLTTVGPDRRTLTLE
jgi:S1-C subfamily serine protease